MKSTRTIIAALAFAALWLAAPEASASFHVTCVMKAKIIKVLGPAQQHQVKARFRVTKIVRQGGYSSTWCNKYRKKILTRDLNLPSKKVKLRKGQRVVLDYSYSHPRGSDGSEYWSVKKK